MRFRGISIPVAVMLLAHAVPATPSMPLSEMPMAKPLASEALVGALNLMHRPYHPTTRKNIHAPRDMAGSAWTAYQRFLDAIERELTALHGQPAHLRPAAAAMAYSTLHEARLDVYRAGNPRLTAHNFKREFFKAGDAMRMMWPLGFIRLDRLLKTPWDLQGLSNDVRYARRWITEKRVQELIHNPQSRWILRMVRRHLNGIFKNTPPLAIIRAGSAPIDQAWLNHLEDLFDKESVHTPRRRPWANVRVFNLNNESARALRSGLQYPSREAHGMDDPVHGRVIYSPVGFFTLLELAPGERGEIYSNAYNVCHVVLLRARRGTHVVLGQAHLHPDETFDQAGKPAAHGTNTAACWPTSPIPSTDLARFGSASRSTIGSWGSLLPAAWATRCKRLPMRRPVMDSSSTPWICGATAD